MAYKKGVWIFILLFLPSFYSVIYESRPTQTTLHPNSLTLEPNSSGRLFRILV